MSVKILFHLIQNNLHFGDAICTWADRYHNVYKTVKPIEMTAGYTFMNVMQSVFISAPVVHSVVHWWKHSFQES